MLLVAHAEPGEPASKVVDALTRARAREVELQRSGALQTPDVSRTGPGAMRSPSIQYFTDSAEARAEPALTSLLGEALVHIPPVLGGQPLSIWDQISAVLA